jgi:hypothetical protein
MGYDTMLLGHWHQWIPMLDQIVNGSLKGYDEYANQQLRLPAADSGAVDDAPQVGHHADMADLSRRARRRSQRAGVDVLEGSRR